MDYSYGGYVDVLNGVTSSLTLVLTILLIVIILAFVVVTIIALWKVFKKAGKKRMGVYYSIL